MCLLVSGKNAQVIITEIAVTIAAIINGSDGFIPTVKAEIAGPAMKPNPKAAPIIPNPFARSSGFVVSEMTAVATGIFPAVRPSRALAINKNMTEGAKAIVRNEITVPISEMTKSGFLPYLSENLPITGVDRNWQRENKENSKPFPKSDRP